MYTFEKIKTNNIGPDGLPIWEVVIRDRNGHAVHHADCCYTHDLDLVMAEFQTACQTISDPWEIKMVHGDTVRDFAFYLTEQEAKECCKEADYHYLDPDGIDWRMVPRRIAK